MNVNSIQSSIRKSYIEDNKKRSDAIAVSCDLHVDNGDSKDDEVSPHSSWLPCHYDSSKGDELTLVVAGCSCQRSSSERW